MQRIYTAISGAERGAIIAVAVGSLFVLAFVRIAAFVAGETPGEFDVHIMTALRNANDLSDPIGPGWLEEAMRDLTALGGTTVLVMLSMATFGYLVMTGKSHSAYMLAASVFGAMLLSQTLKYGIGRPRPELVPHGARVYTMSFPSGHAMMSTAVYLTLAALLARTQEKTRVKVFLITVASLVSILVGASRVYLGVHWPTDVAAGWAGGAAWAILCWLVMHRLQRRGKVEAEGAEPSTGKKLQN